MIYKNIDENVFKDMHRKLLDINRDLSRPDEIRFNFRMENASLLKSNHITTNILVKSLFSKYMQVISIKQKPFIIRCF